MTAPSWDDLRFFLACLRAGSATRAAQQLDTTVSTVSRRLDRLEADLGVALFLRHPDGLVPTEAAERMAEAAAEAERRVAETVALAQADGAEPEGEVRLAATPDLANFVLLPHLGALLDAHPRLRVQFILGNELAALSRREADVAVRIGAPGAEPELVPRHLRDEPLELYASTAYLARFPATLALEAHRWLALGDGFADVDLHRWFVARLPKAEAVFRSNDLTSLRLAAGAGLGVAVLPRMYGQMTPYLRALPVDLDLPATPLFLVTHRSTRRTAAVRVVCEWVTSLLAPRAGRDEVAMVRAALAAAYGMAELPADTAANHNSGNVRPVRRE